jgi:hypothetical protein
MPYPQGAQLDRPGGPYEVAYTDEETLSDRMELVAMRLSRLSQALDGLMEYELMLWERRFAAIDANVDAMEWDRGARA